jgi:cytochrome c biogenesis protein CcmG/thiol:disulfide interchange protein DsbE
MGVTGTGVGEGGEADVVKDRAGVGPTDAGTDALAAIDGAGEGPSPPIGRAIAAATRSATTRTPRPIPAVWANLTRPSIGNYYTACGMSEYTSRSAASNGTEPPAAAGDEPPVATGQPSKAAARALIGPFTARQIGLASAVVAGAALVLFVVTRPLAGDSPATFQPGATFYRISAETEGLQIGQRAPDFVGRNGDQEVRLTDLDGREVRLSDFAGKPVWVVFWATWCPPCQQETPDIRSAFEANRDAGLVVLAIDVQEPAGTIREYAQRYGLTYTIGVDAYAAIMRAYRVFGLPTHYFIDRQGVIRDRYFGPLTRDQMEQRVTLISQP